MVVVAGVVMGRALSFLIFFSVMRFALRASALLMAVDGRILGA